MTTDDRSRFTVHDLRLLDLTRALHDCQQQRGDAFRTLRSHAARVTVLTREIADRSTFGPRKVYPTLEDVPAGTIAFDQAKRIGTREQGFWTRDADGWHRTTSDEALEVVHRVATGDDAWAAKGAAKTEVRFLEAERALRVAQELIVEHESAYRGWSRFYLVVSSPGHVHRTTECSTCYATTQFLPLPVLSGADEAEAVELVGDTLCSVCFPSVKGRPAKLTKKQARGLLGI